MDLKKFKTEKFLSVLIVVVALFLVANVFGREIGTNVSLAEEESGASVASSNESSSDEDSESSNGDDGVSEDGASEESNEEKSEASASSVASIKRTPANVNVEEISEKSSSEASQQSVEEASEASEPSEPSEKSQEISEESIKYVEGYGDIVSREGNIALVKKDEKLFFLIPVEVESQVTLDEQGSVVDAKKSFLNWLLSVFSF